MNQFITFYKNSIDNVDVDPSVWMSQYIIRRLELNQEQVMWFCFLQALTYHLPSALVILNEFPDIELLDIDRFEEWWEKNRARVPFQKDKQKPPILRGCPDTVHSYQKLAKGAPGAYLVNRIASNDGVTNFNMLLKEIAPKIHQFGRFSVWNWAQNLAQVAQLNIEPDTLLLGTGRGFKSHTFGLALAQGRDDIVALETKLTKEEKVKIEDGANQIVKMLKGDGVYVDNYLLETVACAYRKMFRTKNSRYVGYYLDRQAEDILKLEGMGWSGIDWSILWDARTAYIPKELNRKTGVEKQRYLEDIDSKITVKMSNRLF